MDDKKLTLNILFDPIYPISYGRLQKDSKFSLLIFGTGTLGKNLNLLVL